MGCVHSLVYTQHIHRLRGHQYNNAHLDGSRATVVIGSAPLVALKGKPAEGRTLMAYHEKTCVSSRRISQFSEFVTVCSHVCHHSCTRNKDDPLW